MEERLGIGFDAVKEGQSRPLGNATMMLEANERLMAENDEGCVEYKWRLVDIPPARLEHLITQMQFRVTEGKGQCMYQLGVADDGEARGLLENEYAESLRVVNQMADRLGFHVKVNYERTVSTDPRKLCGEIIVTNSSTASHDVSIAVCGDTNAGKSTLVGVLSTGAMDDGEGTARQRVFNHKHELFTGRTSSLSQRVVGFDEMGRVTNYDEDDENDCLTQAHNATRTIANRSVRLVNLMDFGGDPRYAKTTLLGMTSRTPGYACVVISPTGTPDAAQQYFHLCEALNIPFFVVITKADVCETADAMVGLEKVAAATKKTLVGADDIDLDTFTNGRCVPVFTISCVTGVGLPSLKSFIHKLPTQQQNVADSAEAVLYKHYQVEDVGPVVVGHVSRGRISVGSKLFIGPDRYGIFSSVTVKSIHTNGSHVQVVSAGDEGAFALSHIPADFDPTRKGSVLAEDRSVLVCREFDATVTNLSQTLLQPDQEPILHCRNIRQAVKIVSLEGSRFLKRNQTGKIRCRFLYHPEVLGVDDVIVLRSNQSAKIVGKLVAVYPLTPAPGPRHGTRSVSPMPHYDDGSEESSQEPSPCTKSSTESSCGSSPTSMTALKSPQPPVIPSTTYS